MDLKGAKTTVKSAQKAHQEPSNQAHNNLQEIGDKRVRVADVILGIRPDAAQLQGYDLK